MLPAPLPAASARDVRNGYIFGFITVSLWAGFVLLSRTAEANGLNGFDLTALRFGTAALFLLPAWLFWHRVALFDRLAEIAGEYLGVIGLGVLCLGVYSIGNLHQSWPGDLLLISSSCLWGLYTVLVKRWGKTPWDITIGVALLSAIIYLPFYWLFLPKGLFTAPWHAILLQAFFQGVLVVIVAMLCFMQAMARLGPTRLGAVMATVPAFAGIGAVVLLGEPFSWLLVAGLLLTCSGAWLGSRG